MLKTTKKIYLKCITATFILASSLISCSETNQEDLELLTVVNSSNLSSDSVRLTIPSGNMTASVTESGYDPANVNDDSYDTKWRADGTSINLIAELESVQIVDYINISHSSGTSRNYKFEVWTRESSSSSWVKSTKFTSPGTTNSLYTYDITDVEAKFVRIKCNGNQINDQNEIKRLEIWGTSNDGDDVSPSITTSSTSFISTNDGTFNLDDFEIESSSHLSSSTSKTTTSWDYDDTESDIYGSEWYKLSGNDYYLKSASYDGKRTEFKEFAGNESSLYTEKEFKYEAAVDDIPEHGVTIAQVHNRGGVKRPYLRVYLEDGRINVKETTNSLTSSNGSYYAVEGPSYSENSKFKVQITTSNGSVNVKVETTSGTLDEDFTPSGDDGYKNDYYLKAGVYTEGNDTDPIIRFYSIQK